MLKKTYSHISPLEYYIGGIVEEAWETFTGSENEHYSRTFLPLARLADAKQRRGNLDLSFPREFKLHMAEYGDMTWYETAAIQAIGLNLRVAVNIGASLMAGSTAFETFTDLDKHIAANPAALRISNTLKTKSGLYPMGSEGADRDPLPDEITCEDNAFMVFGRLLRQLTETLSDIDQSSRDEENVTGDIHAQRLKAAEYAGQLLWCQGFVLQNHFGSSLNEVATSNVQKTRRRQRQGTTFGSGDAR